MDGRLHKRGKVWYGTYYIGRRRVTRSTRCCDQRAAASIVCAWERAAADPTYATSNETTVSIACHRFLAAQASKGRAEGTLSCNRVKCGHLLRVLGSDTKLALINAKAVDDYTEVRLREGASRHTLKKEFSALSGVLKVAKRQGSFSGELAAVMPVGFSPGYEPRDRFLTPSEAHELLGQLSGDRRARVAFLLATGARWSESDAVMRSDIDRTAQLVLLRGTKTTASYRQVPIVGFSIDLLDVTEQHAQGNGGKLFRPWSNVRRDLAEACRRIVQARVSNELAAHGRSLEDVTSEEWDRLFKKLAFPAVCPTDLRRTCATWLRQLGVEPHLISRFLGHTDSRMVERVYGRIPAESLGRLMTEQLGKDFVFSAPICGSLLRKKPRGDR